jgi:uncharacterized protein YjiS (DUF1127 family)
VQPDALTVECFGNLRIAGSLPRNITWERSMRIVDQVHHDTSSSAFDSYPEYSDPLAGAAPACEAPACEVPASGDGSPQPRSESNASRHPIATAMSWLVAQFIEGCAAYGEAVYPCLLDLAEHDRDQEPERDSQRRWQAQVEYRSELPWPSTTPALKSEDSKRSAKALTIPTGSDARVASVATRFWARIRRKRQTGLTIARLEALDDRTLKDIGIHQSQIESTVRHGDRYEW